MRRFGTWVRVRPFCADRGGTGSDEASVAHEELVAELGSAFLCADLGLSPEPREEDAPYIASWLKALDDGRRAAATAATQAQRGVDFSRTGGAARQAA